MHREAADVAAGKEQRRDDVGVGGHHQAPRAAHKSRRWQYGAIVALTQEFVVEMAREQFIDQLRHGPPTGAMGQINTTMFEVNGTHVAFSNLFHTRAFC